MKTTRATKKDVARMIDWAAGEGWNPGLDDLDPFWLADPDGYWTVFDGDEMIAAVSLVHHEPAYAFLGFYITSPERRGQGVGYDLWTAALETSRARTIGLDGVVAQQDNYRKSGFSYAHANFRYGGEIERLRASGRSVRAETLATDPLLAFDKRMNGIRRANFLTAWLKDTPHRKSLAIVKRGEIAGLATIRTCQRGHKIGPLFAEDADVAEHLFNDLVAEAGGGEIFLDVPAPNLEALSLCRRYGLEPKFETARMYRGPAPELSLDKIYGITTFELG